MRKGAWSWMTMIVKTMTHNQMMKVIALVKEISLQKEPNIHGKERLAENVPMCLSILSKCTITTS